MALPRLSPHCRDETHLSCPHAWASGVKLARRNRGSHEVMCICECHSACPVFGRESVSDEDWLSGCTCPGATSRKEIHVQVREESEQRKVLRKEAMAEVVALDPKSREEILQAFEAAYQRRGLELTEIEKQTLPDTIEVSRMSGPRRDVQGLKLLGRLGTSVVREIRRILAEDKVVDPEEKPYNDLVDRARSLGDAGREDQAAVNELRELAGAGGAELLDRAAQSFCVQDRSFMDEYDNWDLSYRLLRAAATSGAIEPRIRRTCWSSSVRYGRLRGGLQKKVGPGSCGFSRLSPTWKVRFEPGRPDRNRLMIVRRGRRARGNECPRSDLGYKNCEIRRRETFGGRV